jgi:DNA-binding NtrC family response regulator/tetratricopeptide (TPR) repeat protein
MGGELYYEVSARSGARAARMHAISVCSRSVIILQCGAAPRAMPLIAERFLVEDDEVVDLATGENVRLSIDPACARTRARAALCDRLFDLRHPLLVPLIDYGMCGDVWFEAHACLPPVRATGVNARASALHLVRFLRSAGVELDADAAGRHVRPAVDASPVTQRPIGIRLQRRDALDLVRTVLESSGPPGVTSLVIHAPHGTGLRTARMRLARAARLAGYLVIDSRFGPLEAALAPPRHLCVIDWLSADATLPIALAITAAAGARRHVWIRFCRHPAAGAGAIGLEPLMTRDLMNAIYLDSECGPTVGELRCAVAAAHGRPGVLIDSLAAVRGARGSHAWVHETAPEYVVHLRPNTVTVLRPRAAGVARLERAVDAATALAGRGRHARAIRLLTRCGGALAARGATSEAAASACTLGDLLLERGQPEGAAAAFDRAQRWSSDPDLTLRALLGSGRALLERGRLVDAEAVFRTALAAEPAPAARSRRLLAETLMLRGRVEAAEEALGNADAALLSTIARLQGDLPAAARAASRALEAPDQDPVAACTAHLAMAHVQAALGAPDVVRHHAGLAEQLSRHIRAPGLRLRLAAEAYACLDKSGATRPPLRARLLRAARKLPPLAGARVRIALGAATPEDTAVAGSRFERSDLAQRLCGLLAAIHDAPDEATALQVVAADVLRSLDACSVVVRSSRLAGHVIEAGRSWPAADAVTQSVLEGAGTIFKDGVTPSAAEPIVAGGSILGCIAVRWVMGAQPPRGRIHDLLRTAAAAAAPMVRVLAAQTRADRSSTDLGYPDELLGPGSAAERVRDAIRRAALAPYPVLIEGESGSGKELVARAIHARSDRRARKFCAVNCAALTDDLLEAELFGHARGAYTGAIAERPGLFEEADQGTLFLDEAGELSARAQAKLLRVLQEGEIRRVGENLPRKVDTRIVAATNRVLDDEVRAGRFRADLRFRLDVIRIAIPPLRERPDAVPWLAERLWLDAAQRVGTRAILGADVIGALARYDWPGNVRELQNVIATLAVHGPRRGRVPAALLPAHLGNGALQAPLGIDEARLEFERRFVRAALARAGGRRSVAAAQLGVSRQGLSKILKRLGIVESSA